MPSLTAPRFQLTPQHPAKPQRFVRRANELELPVVIVNRGPTRGDPLADLLVDAGCSQVLSELAAELGVRAGA